MSILGSAVGALARFLAERVFDRPAKSPEPAKNPALLVFQEPYGLEEELATWTYDLAQRTLKVSYWPRDPDEGFSDEYVVERRDNGEWVVKLTRESFDKGLHVANFHIRSIFQVAEDSEANLSKDEKIHGIRHFLRIHQRRLVNLTLGVTVRPVPLRHVEALERKSALFSQGGGA